MLQGESKIVIIENTLFSQDWIDESLNPFRYAKTLRFHLVYNSWWIVSKVPSEIQDTFQIKFSTFGNFLEVGRV